MNKAATPLKICFYTLLIITYLFNIFLHSETLNYYVGLIAIGCILISIKGARRIYKILSSLFLTAGFIMLSYTDIPWTQIPAHLSSSVLLLALLYVLPFINSVFKVGRYDRQISKLLKVQAEHYGQLYYRTSLTSYLLSMFLFFAALPLAFELIQKYMVGLHHKVRNKFIGQSIIRGFAMAMIWSPIEILVVLGIEITGVSYLSVLPWLMMLSLILLSFDWWRGWKYKKIKLNIKSDSTAIDRSVYLQIIILFTSLILFITASMVLNKILVVSFLTAITLVIIPYSLAWALCIRKFRAYLRYSSLVWKIRTPTLQNFMLLFLALGFFNSVIAETSLLELLSQPLISLAETPILLFIAIQLLSLCLPLIGFHPLVTISLFGILVQPILIAINPISITIVLITSSLATASAGTYNTTVTLMSGMLKVSPYQITWWNFGYALLYGSLGTLLAVLLL